MATTPAAVDHAGTRGAPARAARANHVHALREPYAGAGYTFTAQTRFDKLFAGVATPRQAFIETTGIGTEGIRVEDPLDFDYGRRLEQVYGKGVSSPTGTGRLWYCPLRHRIELAA
jgi:hypothetical protein